MKLTKAALKRAGNLLRQDSDAVALRVGIKGGGCSGFNYSFTLAEEITDDDTIFRQDNVTVVVDPMSLMYLEGCTVDYTSSLAGDHFVINNPQATTTCGCGTSFSVD